MQWNETTQARFNELRVKKFEGNLNDVEATELANLHAYLEQDTADYLTPLLASLENENAVMLQELTETNEENSVLLQIIEQQKQLVADAEQWLTEFKSRHNAIRQTYENVTGKPLVV